RGLTIPIPSVSLPRMRFRLLPLLALSVLTLSAASDSHRTTFDKPGDVADWVVEQQPGGSVRIADGALVIDDEAGCTVWFKRELHAPLRIRYQATVTSAGRVSDLNCFWMASDPDHPGDLFASGHGRTGKFATYDQLRLYYVGYGGNANSTTRFRRYDGTGARPLSPDHDLTANEFMLIPDHTYTIELTVDKAGKVTYTRDGEVLFSIVDPEPLLRGWF